MEVEVTKTTYRGQHPDTGSGRGFDERYYIEVIPFRIEKTPQLNYSHHNIITNINGSNML